MKPAYSADSISGIVLLGIFLVLLSWYALSFPALNFDLILYIASYLSANSENALELHASTYSVLRDYADPDQFRSLVSSDPYSNDLYEDPEKFASQINMYKIKPLYILVASILAHLGVHPILAFQLISLISCILICMILFSWLNRYVSHIKSAIVVIFFAIGSRMFDLPRVVVPDTFSALILFAGVWLLVDREKPLLGLLFCLLSVWVRTTNIVFLVPLCATLIWRSQRNGKLFADSGTYYTIAALFSGMVSYFWINSVYGYNWWRLFYHTFISKQSDINSFAESFSYDLYLNVLAERTPPLFTLTPGIAWISTSFPAFLLILTISWASMPKRSLKGIFWGANREVGPPDLAMLCVPVFVSFVVLFPLTIEFDRFFTAFYAMIIVFAASRFSGASRV